MRVRWDEFDRMNDDDDEMGWGLKVDKLEVEMSWKWEM